MKSLLAPFTAVRYLLGFLLLVLFFSCSKEYSMEIDSETNAIGKWEFTEGATQYMGTIDSSYLVEGDEQNELHIIGHVFFGTEEFHLTFYAKQFGIGTYKTSDFTTTFDYGNQSQPLYSARQSAGEFTVNITTSNETLLVGNFSGKAIKNGSDYADIVKGSFTAVMPDRDNVPDAVGTLGSSAGTCSAAEVFGIYQEGIELNSTNTVQLQVTVSTPGKYKIYTDPVNNVSFKGTGTFLAPGDQTVILTGSGIPAFPGGQEFQVHFGTSSCSFRIDFLSETASSDFDYYPSKPGNWWQYLSNGSNTYFKVINQEVSFNGNAYTVIGEFPDPNQTTFNNALYLRKNSGNYYQMIDFGSFMAVTSPNLLETIILKDNVPEGSFWDSQNFGIDISGVSKMGFIRFTIVQKGVGETVGNFNFPDIIKVKGEIFADGEATGTIMENWYAKNVGLVYTKDFSGKVIEIKDYRIF